MSNIRWAETTLRNGKYMSKIEKYIHPEVENHENKS